MTDFYISKFGGSSVADAKQIEKVRKIVASDARRRVVVVSGPGRSEEGEQKVTDHLINIATSGEHFFNQRMTVSAAQSRDAVIGKFTRIVEELAVDGGEILTALKKDLDSKLAGDQRVAFLASRGEHYNARIIAAYFAKRGMEARAQLPEDFGLLVTDNYLSAKTLGQAYQNMAKLEEYPGISVVPGYYGVTEKGDIAVFSRGGSDLTGGG